ncbi:MAG: Mur ligase domain-containing protein, partial [Bacteroidetes bacterium]|nr:Mur ligase domain-containing protein [Bacteroidota bacterium]
MNWPKHIYFVGIGGIGMSALARFFHARGHVVAGYDRSDSPLIEDLRNEGLEVL